MQIETTRFGTIAVEDTALYHFPEGIPGFAGDLHFVFFPHRGLEGNASPIRWMQCVEEGALAFPVINPWHVRPDYAPTIPGPILRMLGITDIHKQMRLYSIMTIPTGDLSGITINLLAPVVVNKTDRIGRQVLVQNENYPLRAPLTLPVAPPPADDKETGGRRRRSTSAAL
ncbi:MAG TPA: flagellar assembly protein FliW [Capsulimonadaceae bacterium]|nr:flagellar assembly protein FliW [Capsulimonadaceae bacterium]